MPFMITQGDLTTMKTDAIVNAANNRLAEGGGVCGAIFRAAGRRELAAECSAAGYCETGQSVMTKGYGLPAKHVVHTVGPVWHGGSQGEEQLLASCYRTALTLAKENGLESIAFPLISSGIFGYPKEQAFAVASRAIQEFLAEHEMDVYMVLFDKGSFLLGPDLMQSLEAYVATNFHAGRELPEAEPKRVEEVRLDEELMLEEKSVCAAPASYKESDFGAPDAQISDEAPVPAASELFAADEKISKAEKRLKLDTMFRRRSAVAEQAAPEDLPGMLKRAAPRDLASLLGELDEGFSRALLRLITEKGLNEVDVYKKANIDRKHFAKIKKDPDYKPKKSTVLSFAIALKLDLTETRQFLEQAGFALSHASKEDVIVEYFISQGIHDIFQINQALFAFDQIPLGC